MLGFPKTEKVRLDSLRNDTKNVFPYYKTHIFKNNYGIEYDTKHKDFQIVFQTSTILPKNSLNKFYIQPLLSYKYLLKRLRNHPHLIEFLDNGIAEEKLIFKMKNKFNYKMLIVEHTEELTNIQLYIKENRVYKITHQERVIYKYHKKEGQPSPNTIKLESD